jgi:xylose isomerase domain protein TIM barrel
MSHHYSLAYLTVGDLEPSAQVYVAAAAGYEYVGLRPIPMGLPSEPRLDLPHDRDLLEACRVALAETGVRVWDIELARVMAGIDYDSYLPALEVGAELGATTLLASVWTEDLGEQVDGLGRVAERAGRFGLRVVAEFVALSAIQTPEQMSRLVREVGAPNLGILIDVYHWMRAGASLKDIAALPPQWLPMLHLCDCSSETPPDSEALRVEVRERRLYVGEGDAPIPALVAALPADAVLAIEQPNLARLRTLGDTEYATRCLAAARATIPA